MYVGVQFLTQKNSEGKTNVLRNIRGHRLELKRYKLLKLGKNPLKYPKTAPGICMHVQLYYNYIMLLNYITKHYVV